MSKHDDMPHTTAGPCLHCGGTHDAQFCHLIDDEPPTQTIDVHIDIDQFKWAVVVTRDRIAKSPFWTARDEESVRLAMKHLCEMLKVEVPL